MKLARELTLAFLAIIALVWLVSAQAYEPELTCTVIEDRKPVEGMRAWALACSADSGWSLVADEASPMAKWMGGRRRVLLRVKGD